MTRLFLSLCLTLSLSAQSLAGDHLITVNASDWQEFKKSQLQTSAIPTIASANDTVAVRVSDADMEALTEFFHHQKNRCGGFFAHSTEQEARAFLTAPMTSTIMATYTIDQQAVVTPLLPSVAESNIRQTISTLSAYQNRWYNGNPGKTSSEWIRDNWAQIAQARSDISVVLKSCTNCGIQQNVVLTIPGSTLASEYVILGAHADSIVSGSMNANTRAPGADDDASGVAVITEVLRVALANNFRPQRTVQFMAYAAEEVGLRGSKALADEYRSQNKNVHGVAQFDMTNYAGTGADVWVMTDNGNNSTIQFLRDLFDTYLAPSGLTRGETRCGYGCSDHASWTQAGFPAAMYAETTFNQTNPNLHTANDTLAASGGNANHSVPFAKLGVAFAYEAGKTGTAPPPPPPGDTELVNGIALTGQSGATGSEKFYVVNVPTDGAINLLVETSGGTGDADMYVKYGSKPTTSVYECRPYKNGNAESCSFATPQAGKYYVMLRGYSAYSGLTIKATHSMKPGGDSFENTNDYNIPDNNATGVQSPITVTGSGNAGTVSVNVNIIHTYIGDLIVDVIAPDGTVYNVHNRSGGSADNINKTYSVNVGAKARAGVWNLRVRDLANVDTGRIDSWKLTF